MASKCAQRKTARLVRIRELRIMVSILDQLQKSKNPNLAALQKSVSECIKKKNYDFKIAKISNEGKVTFE